jgi:hypothetical protein
MANESQEDLARYYQGLANDAQSQANKLAETEAAGLAERKRIADQIASLNRQRQTAITQADRDRIDNSIRVQTNNLQKTDSSIAQLQQQRNTALQQVTANQGLAKEAVGGPPAAKNIPGPDATPAPPAPPPSTIPVTPAATPAAAPPPPPPAPPPKAAAEPPPFGSTQADGNAGEAAALRLPQPSAPQDFVTEADGTFIPSDSSRAAERREEISREENAARWSNSEPQPDFTFDRDGNPVYAGTPEYTERQNELTDEENAVRWANAEPQPDFVYDEATGEMIAGDSNRAAEIRAEQAPGPVPPTLSAVWDSESGSWGVWADPPGEIQQSGFASEAEATAAAGDQFEAQRLQREAELAEDTPATFGPAPVPDNYTAISDPEGTPPNDWAVWNDTQGVYESRGLTQQEAQLRAENLSLGVDEPFPQGTPGGTGLTEEEQRAKDEAAAKANAINQATRQSVYKQGGSSDWRVRLQLAPTSNYLYNQPDGQRGILNPLFSTNGVIFPYTPQIQTTYQAKYTDYDLVHSNFRGVFYQSSRVDDINIRAEFTAQDTNEANYLLAVIHFFRSVTKMFYGKDTERGTPPPLVYLSGLGMDQFYGHPCLVRSFNYSLPNNVDYIRATNVNNYGTDLLTRRTASAPSSAAGLGATGNRILNAGLEKFFPAAKPAPNTVVAQVNNTQLANYVPTKMEIDIVLIPVQTRSQASKQFSLKGFANGNLIRNGFW